MTSMNVMPRPTPAERADTPIQVDVDDDLAVSAATIEDWIAARPNWELMLQEGHESGRTNNVEARILFVDGNQHRLVDHHHVRRERNGQRVGVHEHRGEQYER